MENIRLLLIIIHVSAGITSLVAGIIAMVAPGKGNQRHKKIGRVFLWCMAVIVSSAFVMMTLHRFHLFLFVISIFSGYMTFSGYRVLRRKTPGSQTALDYVVAYLNLLAGAGLAAYGGWVWFSFNNLILASLCLIFAYFIIQTSRTDLIVFRKKEMQDRYWWKYHHMRAMIGAFIASFTAFAVNNGERFFGNNDYLWLLWVLPAAIGVPMSIYWARRVKAEDDGRKVPTPSV